MLKKTALFEEHKKLGGRIVDFGGWELPVQYTGVMDEHNACRNAVGLFDVSHMGEIHAEGKDSEAFLNFLVTNNVAKLNIEQALYTPMCNEKGGIVDDLLIYRRAKDRFLLVVNASNTDKDWNWIKHVYELKKKDFPEVRLSNESANYTQIAIQGRHSAEILQQFTTTKLADIKYYWFKEGTLLGGIPAVIAQTGYTGEYGFEVYVPWDRGPEVWRALYEAGQKYGLKPCGLGARDTLRFEMRFPLYGHELNDNDNPLESGIEWTVKINKGDFMGRGPTVALKERGLSKQLVGVKLLDRGIPRQGYPIWDASGQRKIGTMTSGTQAPSLGTALGVASIESAHAATGTKILVEIRGTKVAAEIVPTPFYKRPY